MAILGGERAVVLRSASDEVAVGLRYLEIVEHVGRQTAASVFPGGSAVRAEVHAAVVKVVDPAGPAGWHVQCMVVRMSVSSRAAVGVPLGYSSPVLSGVRRTMQVDAAADDPVSVLRMDDNGVAV